MIRVQKGDPPPGFAARSRKWIARFKAQSETATVFWNHIRRELRDDADFLYHVFHGKCAFCESYMAHVAFAQIEHYKPKRYFSEAVFDWDNWLLSCGVCNTQKGQRRDFLEAHCEGRPCLINPAHDVPADDLHFVRHKIFGDTRRGEYTIDLIQLDRDALNKARELWLLQIDCLLLLVLDGSEDVRAQARVYLIWAMQDEAPYTAMTRCYLQQRAPKFATKQREPVYLEDAIAGIRALLGQYQDALEALM